MSANLSLRKQKLACEIERLSLDQPGVGKNILVVMKQYMTDFMR